MAKMDDRMELIGSAIIGQAHQEARDLIAKANAFREKEMVDFENGIIDSMFGKVQAKSSTMRLTSVKNTAKKQLEAHRTLHLHRSEKIAEVLENVRGRLIGYAGTPEYKDSMLKRAGKLKEGYDHSGSVIMVSEKDMPLAGEISKLLGGGTVEVDPSISLGGFRLLNKKEHILIDETLDERLEEQKPWLLENCGLHTASE